MKHVEQTGSGSWQYRRRVPKDVSEAIAKCGFKRKLGDSQKEALAAYTEVEAAIAAMNAAQVRVVV